jgi:hypothetical protein
VSGAYLNKYSGGCSRSMALAEVPAGTATDEWC